VPVPNRVVDTTLGLPQLALDEIDRRVAQHGTTRQVELHLIILGKRPVLPRACWDGVRSRGRPRKDET
jgi:hypothetical protein